jgi:ABC-2 type transport system permease protein
MPTWLQGFARNQPFSPVIDALRQLLSGHAVGDTAARSVLWWTGILLVSVVVSAVLFRKKTV